MPKAKNPLTPEEQQKRFEEELRKRKKAGDFDAEKADEDLDKLLRRPQSNPNRS
jgi:hypothetical protein